MAPAAALIDSILESDRKAPRKQRHTARRIFDRIHAEVAGCSPAERTVRQYVERRRRELGPRGMLPGLEAIPAAAVLDRLALLKYRNAHGSHIYIRPSGEHRFTTLDDLNETSLARLSVDGFTPCAVVETSAGNFQAWLKHPRVFPKLLSTFAAQTLAARYDADPSAADWRRFGRLPGFTNCKPKYRKEDALFPFVRLKNHSGGQYPMAEAFAQQITKLYEEREEEREARRVRWSLSP